MTQTKNEKKGFMDRLSLSNIIDAFMTKYRDVRAEIEKII